MKQMITAFFLCYLCTAAFSQTGTIVVQVEGINQSKGGVLSTGIFDQQHFPKVGQALFEIRKEISATTMEVIFKNIPAGDYGIASFQDIDNDKNLKTNFIGFPTEPIGFSNGVRIKMGPPSFADARVKLVSGQVLNLKIQLH